MRLVYGIFVATALTVWPVTVFAITLTNRDSTDQKFIVIEGDKQNERVIKANETLQLCEKSCIIRLSDGEDYDFDGPEIVSLQDNLLFLDDAEDQSKAAH